MRVAAALVLALAISVAPSGAQTAAQAAPQTGPQAADRLPRFVIDAQGVFGGLPTEAGWVPAVSANTPLPGHGLGLAGGATVHVAKLGFTTLGVGGSVLTARKNGSPLTNSAGKATTPAVSTQMTSLLPQVSLGFGRRLGWSYLSAGYGVSKVLSSSTAFGPTPAKTAPEAWNPALNFGGGARWFMKPHLGASFDVRFIKLSSRESTATEPGAKRQQTVSFLVGISIQ